MRLPAAVLLLVGLSAAGCVAPPPPEVLGVLTVSVEQQATWIRNFNPLSGGARWPTQAGIHEPLLIHDAVHGAWVPWLATAWAWEGPLALRFDLRPGVRWSDGAPFTARDVAFTFDLMQRARALDQGAVWDFLARVEPEGDARVRFHLARPYAPGLEAIARQPIVPRHRWEGVADPVRFTNPEPVGTGPFTEVLTFRSQVWELGRNPHYWQPLGVERLRFLAFPGNDQANLALASGEVDWAGNFVPAVERTFVAADPAHRRFWFPQVGATVFLYAQTARAPWSDRRVRQALSMAIDRTRLVEVAMYGYARPADGTGLSDAFAGWRDPEAAAAPWARHDPIEAARLLEAAGFTRPDPEGPRVDAAGDPLEAELLVVAGWSDWVRAAQVVARELAGLGVRVAVRTLDFSPWFERVQTGDFDLAIGWSSEGATPWSLYRGLMSSHTRRPLGTAAPTNWHRYASPEADALLAAFERATEPAEQRRIAVDLQRRFALEAPAIPLFPSPSWGVANTRRFHGFPDADAPWGQLSPNAAPECLRVLTRLRPRAPEGTR
jgi:peptide/nickel transport system substrate-binding protein